METEPTPEQESSLSREGARLILYQLLFDMNPEWSVPGARLWLEQRLDEEGEQL